MQALSIRIKFLIAVVVIFVALGASVVAIIQTTFHDRLVEELHRRGISIAKHFAEVSTNPFLTESTVTIEMLADDYLKNEQDLVYIFAVDQRNEVVANTFGKTFPIDLLSVNHLAANQPYSIAPLKTEQGTVYDIAMPVMRGELGTVHCGISAASIDRSVEHVLGRTTWLILGLLSVAGILAVLFGQALTGPLQQLAAGAEIVGRGNLSHRITVRNNDEIGRVAGAFNTMAGNLERTTVNKDDMDRIINTMHDALVVMAADGTIQLTNRTFCNLLGYYQDELTGQSFAQVCPDSLGANLLTYFSASGKAVAAGIEGSFRTRDGVEIPVISSLAEMFDEQGNLQGIICASQDITDLKRTQSELQEKRRTLEAMNISLEQTVMERTRELAMTNRELEEEIAERVRTEEELRHAKEAAELASKAKSTFLSTMSHEIRTPLNAILGMADMINETTLSGEQQEYLGILQRAGNNLLQLLNNVLDIAKIEAQRLEIERIAFSSRELVERVTGIMSIQAMRKGLSLTRSVADDIPELVTGDPNRLQQVLVNLIDNAIKFTERGEVTLNLIKASSGGDLLQFSVTDTGIGITAAQHALVFESFTQADTSTTRKYGGTGLGLTISRQLVELMGGELTIESTPGSGSTFRFTVCLPQAPSPATARLDAAPCGTDLRTARPLHILLADDSVDNRALIHVYLGKHGHLITDAEDGAQAVELFKTSTFDLVLMDIQMPVMDGLDATRAIRSWEHDNRTEPVPIIAVTAYSHQEEYDLCIAAGCTRHLAKPVGKATLIETISAVLPGQTVADPSAVTAEEGRIAVSIPYEIRELIPEYLSARRRDVVTLRESLYGKDFATIRKLGHSLKGSGGAFGFDRISELGEILEEAADAGDGETVFHLTKDLVGYLENVEITYESPEA